MTITEYDVGMATVDITPPVGGPLGGFAARERHTSTSVYHPLRAVATAIGDGEHDVMIISLEWLGCYQLADRIRRAVTRTSGIPEDAVVVNASHTHCGPAVHGTGLVAHGWIDDDYVDSAIAAIARAAGIAARHRNRCTIRYGIGRCDLAMNRRRPDPDRPPRVFDAMLPNPDGPVDHDVPVLTCHDAASGAVRGILFSYACHPTSRGGLAIGGDYVGFAYDHLAEAFPDAQLGFLQGCGGDAKPRPADPVAATFGTRSLEQVDALGAELADAVVAAVGADTRQVAGPIAVRSAIEVLRTEPFTPEGLVQAAAAPEGFRRRWAEHWQATLDRGDPVETTVPFEIRTVTIGRSLALVGLAGEMTAEHGLRLKRDHAADYDAVLPLGYTGAMVGYVPVQRQFDEYGYEVELANLWHLRTGRYLPDTEDRVHARIARLLG